MDTLPCDIINNILRKVTCDNTPLLTYRLKYVNRSLRGEGLYEYSAKWDTDVGCISAKSGVSGGIFIILKGIGGIGIVSPPLDKFGNSVRGIKAGTTLVNEIYKIYDARRKFCRK